MTNWGTEAEMENAIKGLDLDDGTGKRVVQARFIDEKKFDWDLFRGYDTLRVLTYSASVKAIVKMLDEFSFDRFECVFGCEATLGNFGDLVGFQKHVKEDTRLAIMELKDERHIRILERVRSGHTTFRVLRKSTAHAKLYLLSNSDGRRRVIVGSANLSEQAFSDRQPETLVTFDDDDDAWDHYNLMFDRIHDSASDEISLPDERIRSAKIEVSDVPVVESEPHGVIFEPQAAELVEVSTPAQIQNIEKVVRAVSPSIAAVVSPVRNGKQQISHKDMVGVSRVQFVKSADEADHPWFSIDRNERTALLTGNPFPLDPDDTLVKDDAKLMLEYFQNYEGAFEGDVEILQSDYFRLMSWMYFSPFMCDMRTRASYQGSDVIRFPSFAVVFGKSGCGKTSLIDTLMTSMFGYPKTVDKKFFTPSHIRGLQEARKRLPVVFDDIARLPFKNYGVNVIKNEVPPPVSEYPGFVVSMNKDPNHSFADEVVKRAFLIHTKTALPPHDDKLRRKLSGKIEEMRRELSGHLYRRYLQEVMERLDQERLPDWLALSSGVLSAIISESIDRAPHWCRETTWDEYAPMRYNRVRNKLSKVLRPARQSLEEGSSQNGWMIEGDRIVVWEQLDNFGKRVFDWESVPSTLIDDEASVGGTTTLYRDSLEKFIGRSLGTAMQSPASRPWWQIWGRE